MFKGCLNAVFFVIVLGILAAVLVPKMVSSPTPPALQADSPQQLFPPSKNQPKTPAPEVKLNAKDKAQMARDMAKARVDAAEDIERNYLDKGMDVHVLVAGKKKETITFRYVLLSRPAVYKIQKDGDMLDSLRQLGFKKAVFTDGYDSTWTFDLTK